MTFPTGAVQATQPPVFNIRVLHGVDNEFLVPVLVTPAGDPLDFTGYTGWTIDTGTGPVCTVEVTGESRIYIRCDASASAVSAKTFKYVVKARNTLNQLVAILRGPASTVDGHV